MNKQTRISRYNANKSASVGCKLFCPSCGSTFVKNSYQQAFCKSKPKTVCKDFYWNLIKDRPHPNTRFGRNFKSPNDSNENWDYDEAFDYEDLHPFSSEGLGQD